MRIHLSTEPHIYRASMTYAEGSGVMYGFLQVHKSSPEHCSWMT